MTREEAINVLKEIIDESWIFSDIEKAPTIDACEMAISALSENKGEWISYDHGMGLVYLKCPFCGVTIDKRYVEHNFCGKCGAELSGEKSGFER